MRFLRPARSLVWTSRRTSSSWERALLARILNDQGLARQLSQGERLTWWTAVRGASEGQQRCEIDIQPSRREILNTCLSPTCIRTHTLGYPDLIFSPWVVGRNSPLNAFGPKGLANMTDHLEAAYAEDIGIRTEGLEHGNRTGYKVVVKEIEPGIALRRGDLTVTAFPVKHGSWPSAFGYRFKVRDKTIVLSGDTAPCAEIEEQAKGADVLIHEVYAQDELRAEDRDGGGDWPKYLHEFHTSSIELGGIAARAKPKVLVLIHVVRRHATDEALIGEVRKGGFAGQIIVAKDLQSLTP